MRHQALCLCLASLALGAGGTPDPTRLTVDSLFHPARKVAYLGPEPAKRTWMPDGTLLETRPGTEPLRVEAARGFSRPLFHEEELLASLAGEGAPEGAAREAFHKGAFVWNRPMDACLLDVEGDLYLLDVDSSQGTRLTHAPGPREEAAFSPDGTRVAYLKGPDLWILDLETATEKRLTRDGSETRLNGRLDWVYQEEIFERGHFKGFWWSPDSRTIAYLSLDDSRVPLVTLMDDRFQPPRPVTLRYPKAGDPNPVARLGILDLEGRTTWMEDPYPGQETLVVKVGWDRKGRLQACYQDRAQSWLDLRRFTGSLGQLVLREAGPGPWTPHLPLPLDLKDGGFVWESLRTGHRHLYRYDAQARLVEPLTAGPWDVKEVLGVDERNGRLFFEANERTPIGLDAYAIRLGGHGPNEGFLRLTDLPGTHALAFNRTWSACVDQWSDARTPPQQALLDAQGQFLRRLEAPAATPAFQALALGRLSFQQVRTRDGFPMETLLVLPPGFDPSRKYPVLQYIYGGPGAPLVKDAWTRTSLWYQLLAQKGIITWICDNRSSSGKGILSAKDVQGRLGEQELQDQLDGLAWLRTKGFADMDRIALFGYSYGGFLTTYALTHSQAWKAGIAGAPVTDWRLYDSVYTERYMGLPGENAEGYDASSVLRAAGDLHGRLLLIQGTLDTNVHPQNTVQLLDALQNAGLDAPLVLLPGSDHSPRAPRHAWAMYDAILRFLDQEL